MKRLTREVFRDAVFKRPIHLVLGISDHEESISAFKTWARAGHFLGPGFPNPGEPSYELSNYKIFHMLKLFYMEFQISRIYATARFHLCSPSGLPVLVRRTNVDILRIHTTCRFGIPCDKRIHMKS